MRQASLVVVAALGTALSYCAGKSKGGGSSSAASANSSGSTASTNNSGSAPSPSTTGGAGTPTNYGLQGFLTQADITLPAKANVETAQEAVSALENSNDFYDNAPAAAGNCLSVLLNTAAVTATDTTLVAELSTDISGCYASLQNTPTFTINYSSAKYQFYFGVNCAAGGLGGFNGQNFGQVAAAKQPLCSSSGASLFETKLTTAGTYTSTAGGSTVTGSTTETSVSFTGASDLNPCIESVASGILTYAGACIELDTDLQQFPSSQSYTFVLATLAGVSQILDTTTVWPSSGESIVETANWAGTVTYQGPTTAPSYLLTTTDGTGTTQGQFQNAVPQATGTAATTTATSTGTAANSSGTGAGLALVGASGGGGKSWPFPGRQPLLFRKQPH